MNDYFDVDEILGEEDRLPCVFATAVFNLGALDPSSSSKDLAEGSRVELPLWLAYELHQRRIVDVELPRHFGPKLQARLQAGPCEVNLRDRSADYFEVGFRLGGLLDDGDLCASLRTALAVRCKDVISKSQEAGAEDTRYFRQLTNLERGIHDAGQRTAREWNRWRSRKMDKVEASAIVQGHKRRRT